MATHQECSQYLGQYFCPAGAQFRELTKGRYPLLKFQGDDFEVIVHCEGSEVLQTFMASQCTFSSYHTRCTEIAGRLAGREGYYVVIPIYPKKGVPFDMAKASRIFLDSKRGGLGCDMQSMVTGTAHIGEEAKEACCREVFEEIGLTVTECVKIGTQGEYSYFMCDMSSNPAACSEGSDEKENENLKNRIGCVSVVRDPRDVLRRHRTKSGDMAGIAVGVIRMSDYIRLLAAYNSR